MKLVASDDIRKAFAKLTLPIPDSAMMSKCVAVSNNLHISPKAIAECWESFSMTKNIHVLEDHCWPSFHLEIQKEVERNPTATKIMSSDDVGGGVVNMRKGMGKRQVGSPEDDTDDNAVSLPLVTPPGKRANTTPGKATPSAVDAVLSQASSSATTTPIKSNNHASSSSYTPPKYEERKNAGKVVVRLQVNETITSIQQSATAVASTTASPHTKNAKCSIAYTHFETNVTKPYRHLFSTMDDRANALDKHLVRWEDIMKDQYKIRGRDDNNMMGGENNNNHEDNNNDLDIAPLEEVGTPRQDKVCCIGRICNAVRSVQCRCSGRN
jgi:DNA polymerase alpha subunit B N-terminal